MNEEDTLPPAWKQKQERYILRRVLLPGVLAALLFLVLMLAGCAAVPTCPDAHLSVVEGGGKRFFVFDEDNWQRLVANFIGLRDGSCKLPAKVPTTEAEAAT